MTPFDPRHSEPLSRLVLLYLAVAYGADHIFAEAERRTVVHLARRWAPGLDAEAVQAVVDTAFIAMRQFDGDVEALARDLHAGLTSSTRRTVLADLGRIASADGHISYEEADVIARIRATWAS